MDRGWVKANTAIRSTRSPENGAVFWSGYDKGNKDSAQTFARSIGGKTVEMTQAGKWLDQKWPWDKLQSRIGADASKKVWDDISTRFAHGASGEVNAFIKDMRDEPDFPKKTYMDLERPILTDPMNTKVTKLHEHE